MDDEDGEDDKDVLEGSSLGFVGEVLILLALKRIQDTRL